MNLGFPEMLFIFVLALLLFGPKKLPEIARQIGKALAEFKRASNEFQWEVQEEMRKLEQEADVKNTVAPDATANVVAVQPRLSQPENPILPEVRAPEVQPAEVKAPDVSSKNVTI
jgi:sec-independent protein translocase protein TatB